MQHLSDAYSMCVDDMQLCVLFLPLKLDFIQQILI